MEYQVILDDFQGPLDLLLHLIKEKEMDLQTLELSVITDQYLQYIHMMESSQLEVMSEYISHKSYTPQNTFPQTMPHTVQHFPK